VGKVLDGLQIPLKAKMVKVKGTYLEKTAQGYYKSSYLILKNSELYFYSDEKLKDLSLMLVLTPGVFVIKKKEIYIPYDSVNQRVFHKISKLYPIEIQIGGSIGNNGLMPSYFHQGNFDGVITLYFEGADTQNKWTHYLQMVSGSYDI
jgi:hypothetical protein